MDCSSWWVHKPSCQKSLSDERVRIRLWDLKSTLKSWSDAAKHVHPHVPLYSVHKWLHGYIARLPLYFSVIVSGFYQFCVQAKKSISQYLKTPEVFLAKNSKPSIHRKLPAAGRVRNMFRMQCDMSQATTIVVWEPLRCEILSANVMRPVLFFRRMKVALLQSHLHSPYKGFDICSLPVLYF